MLNPIKPIKKYFFWLFVYIPKKIFDVVWRLMVFVNYEFSFTVNLRLIFTPLYGDYTIVGRLIGFFVRIIFIISGLMFLTILAVASLVLPLTWCVFILASIYFLNIWIAPIIALTFFISWYKFSNIPDKKVRTITNNSYSKSFRPETLKWLHGINSKSAKIISEFLKKKDIQFFFKKAELLEKGFEEKLVRAQNIQKEKIEKIAFDYAKRYNSRYVENEHLLVAIVASIKNHDTFLSSFGTDLSKLEYTAEWLIEKREYLSQLFFWQDDYKLPPMGGFGHGLTGRVTPDLDSISRDYTKLAKKKRLQDTVAHSSIIDNIAQTLGGSNENLLLIGEPGCGKTSVVRGIAHRIMQGTEYKSLKNKRVVSLEMGSLIAGATHSGQIADKLKKAIIDVAESKDVILFIDEIHNLVSPVDSKENFSTVFSIIEPYLESKEIKLIGATNIENYRKYIEPIKSFSRLFEIINIPETDFEDTLKVLKYNSNIEEKKYKVEVSMPALLRIIELSNKLIHDRVLPDKALDILNRSISNVRDTTKYVTASDIEKVVSKMTNIPVTSVSEKESGKLLRIESEMKTKVIGQDHAIEKIAAALKRARAGIRNEQKPIASFLFVGTTGVGKTETAKALSEKYFGDKKAMIRLDMSEYQAPDSVDKLLGTSDRSSKGILTEEVRTKPFSVILLDEIEKAHHKVILTFLQVLDDGRLTDSSGRTVDFTNNIIIATSNIGTKAIQQVTQKNGTQEEIDNIANKAVREHFAPEFLNRFTAIVVYRPLSQESIKKITKIMLRSVSERAMDKKIKITFTEELINKLMEKGYNPEWGARPMARVIEEYIETYVANKILTREYNQGDSVTIDTEVFS